jgi:hypothetical protein
LLDTLGVTLCITLFSSLVQRLLGRWSGFGEVGWR